MPHLFIDNDIFRPSKILLDNLVNIDDGFWNLTFIQSNSLDMRLILFNLIGQKLDGLRCERGNGDKPPSF